MMGKVGFDFEGFGGNVEVVIIESDPSEITASTHLASLSKDGRFSQLPDQKWSSFYAEVYKSGVPESLAKDGSKELSTKAIYFSFGDASNWMVYKLFENGELTEEYSFGDNYDEEMLEMGMDPNQDLEEGTVIATNEEEKFIFWSQHRTKTESEICGGEQFIDEFLREQNAYIGDDLYPQI